MPMLDIKLTRKVNILCSLNDDIAHQVEQYAAFAGRPADDVINTALEFTFDKDKEFQKYRVTNPTVASVLRIKKPVAAPAKRATSRSGRTHNIAAD